MTEIVLHERSRQLLKAAAANPPQALALIGPNGSGKTAAAYYLLGSILGQSAADLANHPYGRLVTAASGSISIDAIRELSRFLKLKTPGQDAVRRFAVIEHAELMTAEAQNALLKTLEEPPADSLLILTIARETAILPTVMSRLQAITIHAPSQGQLHAAFATDAENFDQLYRLSGGLPGLMRTLIDEQQDNPLYAAVNTARHLLQGSVFERLAEVDAMAKQKPETAALLQALTRLADAAIRQAAGNGDEAALRRWQKVLNAAYRAESLAQKGAQPKLLLTGLMLEL